MEIDPGDKDRIIHSTEALPEDIQDMTSPMIVVSADVKSLYPSMDVKEVSRMMKEAILVV